MNGLLNVVHVAAALPLPVIWMRLTQEISLSSGLDPSQQQALRSALENRVALIQGPPGTGKTFVGAMVCDAIVRHSSKTILCVCYTNHALDQFLESLLDKGITQIVRMGSRSKSKRLEQYNLFSLTSGAAATGAGGSGWNVTRRMFNLREESDKCQGKVGSCHVLLLSRAWRVRESVVVYRRLAGGAHSDDRLRAVQPNRGYMWPYDLNINH
jgi:hypothetical protein